MKPGGGKAKDTRKRFSSIFLLTRKLGVTAILKATETVGRASPGGLGQRHVI